MRPLRSASSARGDIPSAIANTVEIAKRCNLTLVLGKPQLPDFPTPLVDGTPMPMADYFRVASHDGLEVRLAQWLHTSAWNRSM